MEKTYKIAIFSPYRKTFSAETVIDYAYESITKTLNYNLNIKSFTNTNDIIKFSPDLILTYSNSTPKFCDIPTYNVFAEPCAHRLITKQQKYSYLTYDVYLTPSKQIKNQINDLCFYYNKQAKILDPFTNTRPKTIYSPPSKNNELNIAYFSNNWEATSGNIFGDRTPRFKKLFTYLTKQLDFNKIKLYGNKDGWYWVDKKFVQGPIEFENQNSILNIYNNNGIGLALSSHDQYQEELCNNRIFEIIASGAICIADDLPLYKEYFGDNIFYITTRDEEEMAKQISDVYNWISNNFDEAICKAQKAHKIFCEKLSMEVMLENLINFHSNLIEKNKSELIISNKAKSLTIILNAIDNTCPADLDATVKSVLKQSYKDFDVILLLNKSTKNNEKTDENLLDLNDSNIDIKQIYCTNNNFSTNYLNVINNSNNKFITFINSGDILFYNHIEKTIEHLKTNPDIDLLYYPKVYFDNICSFPNIPIHNINNIENLDLLYENKANNNTSSKYSLSEFKEFSDSDIINLNISGPLYFTIKKDVIINTHKLIIDPELSNGYDIYLFNLFHKLNKKILFMPELTIQVNCKNNKTSIPLSNNIKNRIKNRLYNSSVINNKINTNIENNKIINHDHMQPSCVGRNFLNDFLSYYYQLKSKNSFFKKQNYFSLSIAIIMHTFKTMRRLKSKTINM